MKKAIQSKKSKKYIQDNLVHHKQMEQVRLNKYIGNSGLYSRREADKLIEEGKVLVDGVVAQMGEKVNDNNCITINGREVKNNNSNVYIALNKPVNITCTTDLKDKSNIVDYMDFPQRIFPIGRLDKHSSGLILLTNDGDVVNKVLRSTFNHEKEYIVRVDKKINQSFIEAMKNGVKIYNPVQRKYEMTKKCKVELIDEHTFKIILTQGLNRQIRRMAKTLGYRVQNLKRIRIMNIKLEDLRVGEWRYLTSDELLELNDAINKKEAKI